jgi:hypothetical protein
MTLQSQLSIGVIANLVAALDLVEAKAEHNVQKRVNLANGDGLNEADAVYSDTRTLNGSASEDLDLSNLTDPLGNALALGHIKGLYVAPAGGAVEVGGHASSPAIFADASDAVVVRDGGALMLIAPDATGYAVTSGTGDLLSVGNATGATITYDIVIVGAE